MEYIFEDCCQIDEGKNLTNDISAEVSTTMPIYDRPDTHIFLREDRTKSQRNEIFKLSFTTRSRVSYYGHYGLCSSQLFVTLLKQ